MMEYCEECVQKCPILRAGFHWMLALQLLRWLRRPRKALHTSTRRMSQLGKTANILYTVTGICNLQLHPAISCDCNLCSRFLKFTFCASKWSPWLFKGTLQGFSGKSGKETLNHTEPVSTRSHHQSMMEPSNWSSL